uniref:Protein disulfide-isomerase n=1 Tax=Plectus sambesii TaxID=2011161 RepID=A0A914V9R8_9BILA
MLKLLAVSAALLALAYASSDVHDLHDSDWDEKIKEHEVALVEFYAPWCGHCKRLAPEYEKAATKLKTNDPPIALVKVDCTSDKATCDKFGVGGFPTLKIFRNGEVAQDYDGPREADGIVKYMRGQAGPSAKELTSLADYEKFLNTDEYSVIGFFEGESKLKDSFQKVADTERDRFRFGYTTDKATIKKTGFTDDIVIYVPKRLHNKFEEGEIKYDGNYDTDKIKKFLINEMHGLVGVRSSDNAWQFDKKPLVVVYYNVDYVKDPKGTNYWRNRVLKVAQDFKRKVHFAISNKEDYSQEVEEHGLGDKKESKDPIVAAHTGVGKFPMTADFSIENLKKFVEDLLAEKLEAYMKSEPIPEEQGNVKVVVGRNYKELIEDADKDVLIEFYAPWCGHCKKLTPIYEELGDKLEDEDVIIAKMDATANDVPPKFEVKGFPTIFWVPKDKKNSPVAYQGAREVDDFVKFIAKESTDGLKGFARDGKKKKKSEL